MVEPKKEENKTEPSEDKKIPRGSVLEETKAAIEELKREREEISKIKEELQQLRSDQLLSGTAGGHIEPEKPKEETAVEYSRRVMGGGLNGRAESD